MSVTRLDAPAEVWAQPEATVAVPLSAMRVEGLAEDAFEFGAIDLPPFAALEAHGASEAVLSISPETSDFGIYRLRIQAQYAAPPSGIPQRGLMPSTDEELTEGLLIGRAENAALLSYARETRRICLRSTRSDVI